ncbi:MAG TPA: YqaE/Pmp3 family membrane protein [Allocoleopsis sp.]
MNLLRIILGILLPPLGVFMTVGVGPTLIINILLTLLGWLPGSIHALWVIVKHEERIASGEGFTGR